MQEASLLLRLVGIFGNQAGVACVVASRVTAPSERRFEAASRNCGKLPDLLSRMSDYTTACCGRQVSTRAKRK
jgi:hypothetical protein